MKTKKILALAVIPVFALILSGCGQKSVPAPPQDVAETKDTTPPGAPGSSQSVDESSATAPLPQNPTAAIDGEISGIDKEINSTTEEIDSTELSDAQFGL